MELRNNEAEQRFKSLGTETKRISFPVLFWEEFEKECFEQYNNTYHLKIKADHDYRKSMQIITELVMQDLVNINTNVLDMQSEIEALKEEIISLQGEMSGESKKSPELDSNESTNGSSKKTFG